MSRISNIDWYRHLSFAAVGGFFAAYAILLRMGIMANAQTLNLLDILLNSFEGDWLGVLMHIGALVIYIVGTMSTVFLPRLFGWDMRRVSPAVDALCAVVLAFLPAETPTIPALYPIFFAMSVQWSSFSGAQGNVSSTIFSTNNTKQAALSPSSVRPGKGTAAADVVLCFHHSQLPCRRCGSLLRCGALGDQGFSVRAPFHPLGLLHGGL